MNTHSNFFEIYNKSPIIETAIAAINLEMNSGRFSHYGREIFREAQYQLQKLSPVKPICLLQVNQILIGTMVAIMISNDQENDTHCYPIKPTLVNITDDEILFKPHPEIAMDRTEIARCKQLIISPDHLSSKKKYNFFTPAHQMFLYRVDEGMVIVAGVSGTSSALYILSLTMRSKVVTFMQKYGLDFNSEQTFSEDKFPEMLHEFKEICVPFPVPWTPSSHIVTLGKQITVERSLPFDPAFAKRRFTHLANSFGDQFDQYAVKENEVQTINNGQINAVIKFERKTIL